MNCLLFISVFITFLFISDYILTQDNNNSPKTFLLPYKRSKLKYTHPLWNVYCESRTKSSFCKYISIQHYRARELRFKVLPTDILLESRLTEFRSVPEANSQIYLQTKHPTHVLQIHCNKTCERFGWHFFIHYYTQYGFVWKCNF